jgi:transcription initiation factor IIE alpha subunit
LNEVLVPDDSFDEQMKYAALQFACRACGAALEPAEDSDDERNPMSRR